MAGPVPTYSTTQTAAQTAFNVPFGLLTLVNGAITTATAAGEFSTTVDCSLFSADDVSNLRIYLDSEGYLVEFAKNSDNKSLLIDWGKFISAPGYTTTVTQGTTPWVTEDTNTAKEFGTWSYYAGTSGTVIVSANQRVIGIGCHSTSGGSFTINGGASVPIPPGISISIEPNGNIIAPTIVFIGTDSYFIEVVS